VEIKALKKSKVLEAVRWLTQKKEEEVYLVGGAVRDFLLRRPVGKDFDFVTRGDAEGLAKEVAQEMGGHAFPLDETFGTWRVVLKKKRKKTELDFSRLQGKDIIEDLRQRDFTVNSIAIHLKDLARPGDPCFIDPLGGMMDIRKGILRANSEESLRQDPLRMLRAFRFASTLKFSVEEETLKLIRRNMDLIRRSAGERIRTELFTALGEEGAGLFLRKLQHVGLLGEIFAETRGWENLDLGIGRPLSLLNHALRTVEAEEFILIHLGQLYPSCFDFLKNHFSQNDEEGVSRKALLKFIAFFHDSGKAAPSPSDQGKESPRFLDHDQEGSKINAAIGRRLKLSRRSVRIISELTRQHMRIQGLTKVQELTGRAKHRFFQDLGREGLDLAILSLANALALSAGELRWPLLSEMNEKVNKIREIIDDLFRFYIDEFNQKSNQPLVDGEEIMKALGIPQGKVVGILLNKLKEAEISGRVRTKEDALQFLKNIDKSE
jgi:poly(A) polymerase